jgi:tetratricopeptide (TPR) repeat protein
MTMVLRSLISLVLVLVATLLPAQSDVLAEVLRKYQGGDLAGAREAVDRAVRSEMHAENPEAWLLRGFIYKDVYKGMPVGPEADNVRQEALESLYTCMAFDQPGTYRDNALQAYDFLVRSCFNEAARALSAMDTDRARKLFDDYKAAQLRSDPNANTRDKEIEFGNALGTVYTKQFNAFRTDTVLFDQAVAAYYNLATLHYNRGVYNIQRISADVDIPTMAMIQEASKEYFQKALPYMLKAHEMNPSRRETLLGLEGIYYSLQDQMNADKFRQLFELMPPSEER